MIYVKVIFLSLALMMSLGACAKHLQKDSNYYERANNANQKALKKLEKE